MTSGHTRQSIADRAALYGVPFSAQELQGRSEIELATLMAEKMQQRQAGVDAMMAEATEIKKRDTERRRAEVAPLLEKAKKLGEKAGFTDAKGYTLLAELFDMEEGAPVAHLVSAIVKEADTADTELAKGRVEFAKVQEERSALDAQLTDYKAREHLQQPQRKRSSDGTYVAQQQLPTRMATGGAPAATAATTTSTAAAADTETVETEASGSGGAQKRHQDGLSAFRQRVRGDQGRIFSHIPSAMMRIINDSTSSRTVLTQASAYIGSASGGISAFERKLMARAKKLESDDNEMM